MKTHKTLQEFKNFVSHDRKLQTPQNIKTKMLKQSVCKGISLTL